jgi:hypothetical protein
MVQDPNESPTLLSLLTLLKRNLESRVLALQISWETEQTYSLLQSDSVRRRQRGTLERLDDEVHGSVSPFGTNVFEMMDLATSFVTDLYSELALLFRIYTSRDTTEAAEHGRVHTGSFTAQFCSTFERSAVGNGSPSLPRRRFGSPNMTIDLIFG